MKASQKLSSSLGRKKKSQVAKSKRIGSFTFRGLRELNLSKNQLGVGFMYNLQKCVLFDSYVKSIDLSFNNIKEKELEDFIEQKAISQNGTI